MDVNNGEVLSLVSVPAFDPNEFSKGITSAYWKELNANKKTPLHNKAIAGQYPPGSTFKMVTGLAGLKSGKFNAESRVYCNGTFYLGNHPFGCWKVEGHGSMNMAQAIEQSCDTFFYQLAARIGVDRFHDWMVQFGFGQPTGIDLVNEKSGTVPSIRWKREKLKAPWYPGEMLSVGIGQGVRHRERLTLRGRGVIDADDAGRGVVDVRDHGAVRAGHALAGTQRIGVAGHHAQAQRLAALDLHRAAAHRPEGQA